MNAEQWKAVDSYLVEALVRPDEALDAALKASADAGLPSINVSAAQGKLLYLLACAINARRILEIGTLGGYSTIWLARALPSGGKLITLEADPKHAEVARGNFARAGLAGVIELRLGLAIETLPSLLREIDSPFDLIFIDADKQSIPDYFAWSMKMSRQGTVIIVDNVIRKGAVIDGTTEDSAVLGVRRFNDLLRGDKRVSATAIQTVGAKGYDGFAMVLVLQPDTAPAQARLR